MLLMNEGSPNLFRYLGTQKKGVKRLFNAVLRRFVVVCQVNAKQKKSAVAICATPKPSNAQ